MHRLNSSLENLCCSWNSSCIALAGSTPLAAMLRLEWALNVDTAECKYVLPPVYRWRNTNWRSCLPALRVILLWRVFKQHGISIRSPLGSSNDGVALLKYFLDGTVSPFFFFRLNEYFLYWIFLNFCYFWNNRDYLQIPVTNTRISKKTNEDLCRGRSVELPVYGRCCLIYGSTNIDLRPLSSAKFQLEKPPFSEVKTHRKANFPNLILHSIRVICMMGTSAFKRRRKNVAFLQLGEAKSHKRKPWWIWYDCNHDSKVINKYQEW